MPDELENKVGPLDGISVLEIGDWGEIVGKLLADAGADVIRIETESTAELETFAPFYRGKKDIDSSLYRWHFHTNKRSVELNLASQQGKDTFLHLLEVADVLITTEPQNIDNSPTSGIY